MSCPTAITVLEQELSRILPRLRRCQSNSSFQGVGCNSYCNGLRLWQRSERTASSDLSQDQSVLQLNMTYNCAIAMAINGQTARHSQNCQINTDIRAANVIATSCETLTCGDICATLIHPLVLPINKPQDIQANFSIFE